MVLGDHLDPADTEAPAAWIGPACIGDPGTVGSLVQNQYESVIRPFPPAPCPGDWWLLYRQLFNAVAAIGEQHTSSPDRAWFAVWEGHGFDIGTTHIAHRETVDDDSLEQERAAVRDDDGRRNANIRNALEPITRFALTDRSYYLVTGSVTAVTELRYPGDGANSGPGRIADDEHFTSSRARLARPVPRH